MCLPVICLRLFILISTSQCNIKQIALADRFAMLAVVRLRSETYGSTITAQAARQDSAEFKILAMRSWRENESPWSEFVQFFCRNFRHIQTIFLQSYSEILRLAGSCKWTSSRHSVTTKSHCPQSLGLDIFHILFSHSYSGDLLLLKSNYWWSCKLSVSHVEINPKHETMWVVQMILGCFFRFRFM